MKSLDELRNDFILQIEEYMKLKLPEYTYVEIEITMYDKKPNKLTATVNSDRKFVMKYS